MNIQSMSNKQARMFNAENNPVVSAREYNLILGGVVLYGVLVNMFMVKSMGHIFAAMNPIVLTVGYVILAIAGSMVAYRSKNPIVSFGGYNLLVLPIGAVLSSALQGMSSDLVFQAFLITTIVTGTMFVLSGLFPMMFLKMGRMLFAAVIGLILAQLVCMLLRIYTVGFAWIGAGIFSLYIGYDWVKAQSYVKTIDNAVDSAIDIYLDIINLFLQILRILSNNKDE